MGTYKRVPICAKCGKKIRRDQSMGFRSRIRPGAASETAFFHSEHCYREADR